MEEGMSEWEVAGWFIAAPFILVAAALWLLRSRIVLDLEVADHRQKAYAAADELIRRRRQ